MIDNVDDGMGGFVSFRPLLKELVWGIRGSDRPSTPCETRQEGGCIPTLKGNKSSTIGEYTSSQHDINHIQAG